MPRTYHLWTIGCQMNAADTRGLAAQLESLGLTPTDRAEAADVLVMNTCVIRQQAEDKILRVLDNWRAFKQRRPELILTVMGCLVGRQAGPALRAQWPFVDVFLPPSDPAALLELLRPHDLDAAARQALRRVAPDADAAPALPPSAQGRTVTAQVPAVLGCSHAYAFCVIPYRRGPERSRPPQDILEEIRRLADQGVREVTLLGQIVDRYGLDLGDGADLAGLLADAAHIAGIWRIRFLTSHPQWVTDRLLDAVARIEKVQPYLEVPLQSGHDGVLAAMRRGYTVRQFRELVARIRQRLPDAGINSDIIVGFPGETEAQFMDTCRLLEELRLDFLHIAPYSPRPETYAARRLPDDVPADEKERRRLLLEDQHRRILTEKHQAYVGRTVRVLVEGRDEKRDRWWGRTPQYKLVYFPATEDLLGQLTDVEIEWAGPFTLVGAAVKPQPKHLTAKA
ncbi:MAG: MiaB/RimO family radical SAM methylthiotransferase [Kiritimatiellaeota bacterium]|nr:MiaB/RimO family radical SAM methylthiotransferase [Kiritimatiellota bacterium]